MAVSRVERAAPGQTATLGRPLVNVRVGSCADLQHPSALSLLCAAKPTFSTERQLTDGQQTFGAQHLEYAGKRTLRRG